MTRQDVSRTSREPQQRELLTARRAAEEVNLSQPAFWRAVAVGRLPKPVYPAPRAPRWFRDELYAALDATRALPCEAKIRRRVARVELTR